MIPRNRSLSLSWQVCLAYYIDKADFNPKYTFKKQELRLQNSSKTFSLKGITDSIVYQKAAATVAQLDILPTVPAVQALISQLKFSNQPGDFFYLDQQITDLMAFSFFKKGTTLV